MKEKGSMMNRTVKSAVAMAAVAAMSLGALAACGSSTSGDDAKGKVYYLNFKPEAADQWTALAKEYTKEKGVEVKVQTAASGTYEQTLKSEIAKTEAEENRVRSQSLDDKILAEKTLEALIRMGEKGNVVVVPLDFKGTIMTGTGGAHAPNSPARSQ